MTTAGLSVRIWNDAGIARRDEDGYVNATAMCQANGRLWGDYIRTDRAQEYIAALSDSLGIPADQLVITTTTGPNQFRGTWIHPNVAIDLARVLGPAFAVWMDSWILNVMQGKDQPEPQPAISRSEFDQLKAKAELAANGVMALALHLEQLGIDVDMPNWQQPSIFLRSQLAQRPTTSAWPCTPEQHAKAALRLVTAANARGVKTISPRDVLTWRVFGRQRITALEALQFLREAASSYRLGVMMPGRRRQQILHLAS